MMGLRGILLQQQLLLWAIILAAFAASEPDPSCNRTCGSLNIPYPFGKSESCYLDPSFLINCSDSTPFLGEGNLEVLNISLDGELRISSPIARSCPKDPRYTANDSITRLQGLNFLISPTRNKFTTVGCDTLAVIVGTLGVAEEDYATSCVSLCNRTDSVVNGSCDGIGCCQASIRGGMSSFAVSVGSINNHSEVFRFNPCSFGFVAEQAAYNFSSLDLANLQNRVTLPLVLDWAVGNQTCQDAKKNLTSYACKAENSICSNSINGPGYRCNCSSGYQGNPYLSDGCQDIDECAISNPCTKKCTNILGSYICDDCPKGYQGDGRTNGTGCSPILTRSRTTTIVIELAAHSTLKTQHSRKLSFSESVCSLSVLISLPAATLSLSHSHATHAVKPLRALTVSRNLSLSPSQPHGQEEGERRRKAKLQSWALILHF